MVDTIAKTIRTINTNPTDTRRYIRATFLIGDIEITKHGKDRDCDLAQRIYERKA